MNFQEFTSEVLSHVRNVSCERGVICHTHVFNEMLEVYFIYPNHACSSVTFNVLSLISLKDWRTIVAESMHQAYERGLEFVDNKGN